MAMILALLSNITPTGAPKLYPPPQTTLTELTLSMKSLQIKQDSAKQTLTQLTKQHQKMTQKTPKKKFTKKLPKNPKNLGNPLSKAPKLRHLPKLGNLSTASSFDSAAQQARA
jgi:hypothetical protein